MRHKKGQWVKYTYGGQSRYTGQIGQVTHRFRGLTYVRFSDGAEYGAYEDFLEPPTRKERAVAIAMAAMNIKHQGPFSWLAGDNKPDALGYTAIDPARWEALKKDALS